MKEWVPLFVQIVIAAVAIYTMLQNRAWSKQDMIAAIKSTLDKHIADDEKKDALQARRRIIAFSDECKRNIPHSEEHFNNVLEDIDEYEKYCDAHPDFKNRKAVQSIKFILEIYDERRRKNDFL